MSAAKHTPGPWTAKLVLHEGEQGGETPEEWRIEYPTGEGCWLATVHIGACADAAELAEEEANAHLIAAAPELLVVAEEGLGALERELAGLLETSCLLDSDLNPIRASLDPEMKDAIEALEASVAAARAAIAKATGAA